MLKELHCFLNAGQAIYTVINHFYVCKVTLICDVNNKWGEKKHQMCI